MQKTNPNTANRPIMLMLDTLGKRWTLRVIWELREERLTFRTLQQRCDDVSPTSLNQRLKDLRELELVDHDNDGFGLTSWGHQLGQQLQELNLWSNTWHKAVNENKDTK